jgi:hypothetical protein
MFLLRSITLPNNVLIDSDFLSNLILNISKLNFEISLLIIRKLPIHNQNIFLFLILIYKNI